mmetsp:Transcript_8252/g.20289  ORF Transcript_8252/g.20289 Transcript_8252/m.20289 type:complete len:600 (+) Transcript_8252:121-1920(+)
MMMMMMDPEHDYRYFKELWDQQSSLRTTSRGAGNTDRHQRQRDEMMAMPLKMKRRKVAGAGGNDDEKCREDGDEPTTTTNIAASPIENMEFVKTEDRSIGEKGKKKEGAADDPHEKNDTRNREPNISVVCEQRNDNTKNSMEQPSTRNVPEHRRPVARPSRRPIAAGTSTIPLYWNLSTPEIDNLVGWATHSSSHATVNCGEGSDKFTAQAQDSGLEGLTAHLPTLPPPTSSHISFLHLLISDRMTKEAAKDALSNADDEDGGGKSEALAGKGQPLSPRMPTGQRRRSARPSIAAAAQPTPSPSTLRRARSAVSEGSCLPPPPMRQNAKEEVGPAFDVGTIVFVEARTWTGRNDLGGVARILKVHHGREKKKESELLKDGKEEEEGIAAATKVTPTTYDVKYVVELRREKGVEEKYVTLHSFSPVETTSAVNGEEDDNSTIVMMQNSPAKTIRTNNDTNGTAMRLDASAYVAVGTAVEEVLTAALMPLAHAHVGRCRRLERDKNRDRKSCQKRSLSADSLMGDDPFHVWTLPPVEALARLAMALSDDDNECAKYSGAALVSLLDRHSSRDITISPENDHVALEEKGNSLVKEEESNDLP